MDQALEIGRRVLLDRGASIRSMAEDRITARQPGTFTQKRLDFALEFAPEGDGTRVRAQTWTTALIAAPGGHAAKALDELAQTLRYEGSRAETS